MCMVKFQDAQCLTLPGTRWRELVGSGSASRYRSLTGDNSLPSSVSPKTLKSWKCVTSPWETVWCQSWAGATEIPACGAEWTEGFRQRSAEETGSRTGLEPFVCFPGGSQKGNPTGLTARPRTDRALFRFKKQPKKQIKPEKKKTQTNSPTWDKTREMGQYPEAETPRTWTNLGGNKSGNGSA